MMRERLNECDDGEVIGRKDSTYKSHLDEGRRAVADGGRRKGPVGGGPESAGLRLRHVKRGRSPRGVHRTEREEVKREVGIGRMITEERGQRAAAMIVGEVDRRETADAVKAFCLELRDAAESHLR